MIELVNTSEQTLQFSLGGTMYSVGPGRSVYLEGQLATIAQRRGIPLVPADSYVPPEPEPVDEPDIQSTSRLAPPKKNAPSRSGKKRVAKRAAKRAAKARVNDESINRAEDTD